jgi:hypothetical protein
MDRGGFNSTHKFYSVHYKLPVLFERYTTNLSYITIAKLPMVITDLTLGIRVLTGPILRPVSLKINLRALAPPNSINFLPFTCGNGIRGQKPLRLAEAGALVLGIALASAITTPITAPLYTEVNDLSRLTAKQSAAIASVSDGLTP